MIIEKSGDIFTSKAPIICHGVNTMGVMGAGIAAQFRDKFSDMFKEYQRLCKAYDPKDMVGHVFMWTADLMACKADFAVANIFSQDYPGPHARLDWLMSGLEKVVNFAKENGFKSIAIPQIGCGIGGLDWEDVYAEIVDTFKDSEVDIEVWTYE